MWTLGKRLDISLNSPNKCYRICMVPEIRTWMLISRVNELLNAASEWNLSSLCWFHKSVLCVKDRVKNEPLFESFFYINGKKIFQAAVLIYKNTVSLKWTYCVFSTNYLLFHKYWDLSTEMTVMKQSFRF